MSDTWDAVIAGGEPAGLPAALLHAKAQRQVAVLDTGEPRNRLAAHVDGTLGHEGHSSHQSLAQVRVELAEDVDLAERNASTPAIAESIEAVWEARYAGSSPIWSGKVNKVLADVASELAPGSALDLGCGEGGDSIWLARHGWTVTGVDVSPTAITRARKSARDNGLGGSCEFIAADLAEWNPRNSFDLVTSSFLHSWEVEIPREEILRNAVEFVAPGGNLLIVSHAQAPSWSDAPAHHHHALPSPQEDLANLHLGEKWEVVTCESREREATGPNGENGTLLDGVVLVRRTS